MIVLQNDPSKQTLIISLNNAFKYPYNIFDVRTVGRDQRGK